jgi:iduronate 2-sulfatase
VMHALAEGKIWGSGEILSVFEAFDGDDQSYPDGLIAETAIEQINKLYASRSPFFMAVGFIRPHLPFGAPKKYLDLYADCELPTIAHPNKPKHPSSWTNSGEFMRYNRWSKNPISDPAFADEVRRHYAACVSYVDAQVGLLMDQLDRSGILEKTIVVLWGDHGWHLGEHGVWGKHTLFEESLRSPLIISYKDIPKSGEPSKAVVESIDIFPTLCDIANIPIPEYIYGKTLKPQLDNPESHGHSAVGFQKHRKTIRTENHRLVLHNNGYAELYDFSNTKNPGINRAQDFPNIVLQLTEQLNERIKLNR